MYVALAYGFSWLVWSPIVLWFRDVATPPWWVWPYNPMRFSATRCYLHALWLWADSPLTKQFPHFQVGLIARAANNQLLEELQGEMLNTKRHPLGSRLWMQPLKTPPPALQMAARTVAKTTETKGAPTIWTD
jgi:hypothetical protein